MKIDKQRLRQEAWRPADVWWRPIRKSSLVPMEESDRERLERPSSVRRSPQRPRSAHGARSSDEAVDGCDPSIGRRGPRRRGRPTWKRPVSTRCGSARPTDSTRSPCSGISPAARTVIQLGAAILPVFSRSPALVAMTAAGLDFVSSGRFLLGLGASGPQVVTDWHGVPYDRPLARTREIIEVCRKVWTRQRLEYQGETFRVPHREASGDGGGRSLKLMDHPVRPEIPIYVAALGPKNVALAAEVRRRVDPALLPSRQCHRMGGGVGRRRTERGDAASGPLEVVAGGPVAICDEDEARRIRDAMRPRAALYVGGMGPPGQNFYNDLFVRYGYEAEARGIQELYLSGNKKEAEALRTRGLPPGDLHGGRRRPGSGDGLRPSGLRG